MKTIVVLRRLLINAILRIAVLLTLMPAILPQPARADDNTLPTPMPILAYRPDNSAFGDADRQYRLGQLRNYLRQQGPALIPSLSDNLRSPANFMMGQFKSAADEYALNGTEAASGTGTSSLFAPALSLISPSDENGAEALWFVPGYHHMSGMLPFDDALTFGFKYHTSFLDSRVKFGMHPFVAQSWLGSQDYWGTEMALDIGPAASHSWGKIVLRYDNGDSNLMDHGRGIDMHADLLFDRHLSLTAGAQQNEPSDLGNYVMLRWRLAEFGH
jgi:hypothetical protein